MSWPTTASPGPMGPGTASKHPPPPSSQQYFQSPPPPQQQQQHAAQNTNHFNQPLPGAHQQQQWTQYSNQGPTNQTTSYPQNNHQPNNWFNSAQPIAPNHQSFNHNNNNFQQHQTSGYTQPPNHQLTHPPPVAAQPSAPHQHHQNPQTHHSQTPQQSHSFQPKAPPANYQQAPQQLPPSAFQYQPAQPATFANDVMSGEPEQFKTFDNNASASADGWDDDWNDTWNDTSNNNSNKFESSPAQLNHTAAPVNAFAESFQAPVAQQAPFQQPQAVELQQQQVQQPSHQHQPLFNNPSNYQTQLPQQHQQHLPPPPQQQQQQLPTPQQQQQLSPPQQPLITQHGSLPQQHPPQQFYKTNQMPPQPQLISNPSQPPQIPPPSQSPFVGQSTAQIGTPNIADSFNANDNNNWNWNPTASSNATVLNPLADTPSTLLDTVPAQFATVGKIASDKLHSRNASNGSNAAIDNNNPSLNSQPDDTTNTHMLPGRTGTNQLTPQWSIESQVSQTSSDRSLDTRSSLTNTSEEHPYQQKFPPKPFQPNGHEAADQQTNEELDFLEQTLHSLNIETQPHNSETIEQSNEIQSFWEQSQFNLNPSGSIRLPNSNSNHLEINSESVSLGQYQFDPPGVATQSTTAYPYSTAADGVAAPSNEPEPTSVHPPPTQTEIQPSTIEKNPQFTTTTPSFPPMSNSPFVQPPQPSQSSQSPFQGSTALFPPQTNSPFMPPPSQSPAIPLVQTPFQTPSPSIARPNNNSGGIPPPTQFTTPPVQSTPGNTNPFKRTGIPTHKSLPSQPIASVPINQQQPPVEPPTPFFQPPPVQDIRPAEMINEPIQPENSEVLPETLHTDRNQYLQTGHLSDENAFSPPESSSFNPTVAVDPNDYLPPPGLSRLVLGQPETNSVNHQTEPPPGLDRMVPGTELVSNLSMERQADGEDTNTPSIVIRNTNSSFNVAPTIHASVPVLQPAPLQNTDRNLYLVPGDESDSGQAQGQRVVTGHNHSDEPIVPTAVNPTTITSSEQRELVMDGENLEDEPIRNRDEPLEGANHLDTQPTNDADGTAAHEVTPVTVSKKFPDVSVAGSTGNDDSDRDRSYYNRPRRSDDPARRREKNPDKRYETEDTDFSDREKEKRRFGREGSVRRSADRERSGRYPDSSRGGDRYREDRSDRGNGSRREADRGDRYAKEKYRYETDGSRYATEDSRYERRDTRRRGDDSRKENDDRKYRRGGEPRSDGRRRDDRYREDRDRDRGQRRGNQSERSSNSYSRHDPNEFETQRSSTRNANDRDWYNAAQQQHQGPSGPQYGIDQYQQYYQQMQYYEHLRRTNPQAYAEIYHRMYSQQQHQQQGQQHAVGQLQLNQSLAADVGASGMTDGRESVHSGCSSTNDQRQPRHDSGTAGESMTVDEEPARLTPCKFTRDHCTASLANGLMVCVKPQFSTHSDFTSVVRIMQLGVNDAKRKLFQLYPGPLARGVTHKKTVIEFCEEQIRLGPTNSPVNSVLKSRGNSMNSLYSQHSQPVHRSSYTLMWNLLILLLRQNGVVVGTDISELLLSNRREFPYEVVADSKGSSVGHPEPVAEEEDEVERDENSDTVGVSESDGNGSTEQSVSLTNSTPISEEEITERFRSFLLYGSINEALDWAADNNLWGHALFLASKVDRRSHANVLMKFANKLSLNDPLQTLYQLMSGRTPNSVTSIQDEKWGDWRPHLAMILANTSPKPELDRKAITTLGDSLYNRGDLFAAQFCYLMAQVGFGRYSNVNQESVLMSSSSAAIRLILLGSSHHRSFREFATNEAIMMTEIYEYACTLNDDHFSIIDFQAYKYLLATRMLDAGLNLKSLMYLEQIAQHIQKNPSKFEGGFIQKVYTLADQLKYFDPVYERMMYEPNTSNEDSPVSAQIPTTMEDQPWLQGLLSTLKQYNFGGSTTYSNEPISYSEHQAVDATNKEFVEISQQLSNLSTQYSGNTELTNDAIPQTVYQPYQPLSVPQETTSYDSYGNQAQTGYDPALPANVPVSHDSYGYDTNQAFQTQPQEQVVQDQQSYDYWNQQQQQSQKFQPSQPDNIEPEMAKPSISMPNSMSNKPNFYDDDDANGTNKPAGSANHTHTSVDHSNASKAGPVIGAKPPNQSSSSNSGWFGGLWNKLSLKPKNQMILPDDKNPSIVWDSDKKKWVNTDGEAEASEQFRPPPKMTDLAPKLGAPTLAPPATGTTANGSPFSGMNMAAAQPTYEPSQSNAYDSAPVMPPLVPSPGPPSMVPSIPAGLDFQNAPAAVAVPSVETVTTTKTPNLQSNMFKMQRNRTLKKSYVDVFNPSGAPAKPLETGMMAPLLPSGPPSGFFIPGGPTSTGQNEDGNQFYNPNAFAGANGPSSYQ